MGNAIRRFTKPMTSQAFDAKVAQIAAWGAAIAVLVLGFQKLCRLPLTETELFFGVVLVMTLGLMMTLIGLVLPLAATAGAVDGKQT